VTFTRQDALKVGFHAPEQCARGRSDCRSLAQIVSSDAATFFCCGEVAPGATPWPDDQWVVCVRGCNDRPGVVGTDVRFYVDRRDLSHLAAVSAMGLAAVIPVENDAHRQSASEAKTDRPTAPREEPDQAPSGAS
jgi:hypothetical protein